MFFVLKFDLILIIDSMCLRRPPEKYIAGAALDRAAYTFIAETGNSESYLSTGFETPERRII
jgi:hypothetical protein